MTVTLVAIAIAFVVAGLISLRFRWANYLCAALLGADAVALLVTHRVAAGVVVLIAAAAWTSLALTRGPGGAR